AQGIFEMSIHEHEIAPPIVPVRWPLILLSRIDAAIERTVGLGIPEHDHLHRIDDVVLSYEPLEKRAGNIAAQPELRIVGIIEFLLAHAPIVVTVGKTR